MPGRIWKSLLGLGALAGAILSVAGVIELFDSDEPPPKPVGPLVDKIEAAATRYTAEIGRAQALEDVVGSKAFDRWVMDSARIQAAIEADFSQSAVRAWKRYDGAMRAAQLVVDDAANFREVKDFRVSQARTVVEVAGEGDPVTLADPADPDYSLEWATVLGRLDTYRKKQIIEQLRNER